MKANTVSEHFYHYEAILLLSDCDINYVIRHFFPVCFGTGKIKKAGGV